MTCLTWLIKVNRGGEHTEVTVKDGDAINPDTMPRSSGGVRDDLMPESSIQQREQEALLPVL